MLGLLNLDQGYFRAFLSAFACELIKRCKICAKSMNVFSAGPGNIPIVIQIARDLARVLLVEQETQVFFLPTSAQVLAVKQFTQQRLLLFNMVFDLFGLNL